MTRQIVKWSAFIAFVVLAGIGYHHVMTWAHTRYTYDYFFPHVRQIWIGIENYREKNDGHYPPSLADPGLQSLLSDDIRANLPKYPVHYFPPTMTTTNTSILLARETQYGFIVATVEGSMYVTNELRTIESTVRAEAARP